MRPMSVNCFRHSMQLFAFLRVQTSDDGFDNFEAVIVSANISIADWMNVDGLMVLCQFVNPN